MSALGLNGPPHLSRVFFFPLGHDVVVRMDFQEPFKDQWEALCGGFLKGQDLHVKVVEAKKSAMALKMGFAEVVIQKSVVFQTGERIFLRVKVQSLFED